MYHTLHYQWRSAATPQTPQNQTPCGIIYIQHQSNDLNTMQNAHCKHWLATSWCLWYNLTDVSGVWFGCVSLAKHSNFYNTESENTSVQHGLRLFFYVLHNFRCFFCFYQCSLLAFSMVLFYNEVVLCDDQKLWCSSIVFKYLMSLKYGLKSVWTSDPAALVSRLCLK